VFVITLKFSSNRGAASTFMEGHKEWIQRGLRDGVFLLAGSLQGNSGGIVFAHNASRAQIDERVAADPFVAARVVEAEVVEVRPSVLAAPLQFLDVGELR